jgi:putative effector of murein hydrolase LrgA (UPF0299 family)
MIEALSILLSCQLIGDIVAQMMSPSVPGPVIGMMLLFAALVWRGGVPEELGHTANGLLRNFSLLFVPAGVGVMANLELLRAEWLPIMVSIIGSTLIAMTVTALLMNRLDRAAPPADKDQDP